jgi:hypothetical protein
MNRLIGAILALVTIPALAAGPVIWGGNSTAKNLQQNVQTQRVLYTETGGGLDTITIQAPASITAPWTLTLPPDVGAADDVITTDGAGVLTWVEPASIIDGTADTFAGFDSLGNFVSIPSWSWVDATDGASVVTTYDPDLSSGTTHVFRTDYNPTANTENGWTQFRINSVVGSDNAGFDLGNPATGAGGVDVLDLDLTADDTGGFGSSNVLTLGAAIGNGTDPVAGYRLSGINFGPNFAANTDLEYLRGVSVNFNAPAGAVIDNYVAFQSGNNFAEPLSGNYNTLLAQENLDDVGQNINVLSTNVNAADIAGGYSVLVGTGNVGDVSQAVNGVFIGVNADSAVGANGFSDTSSYDLLTGTYQGFNAAVTLTDTPGANLFNSSTSIPSSSQIVKVFNDGTSVTSGTDYNSASLTPTLGTLSGYYQGININPTITSVVNATGLAVSMSGVTASGSTKAIQANSGDIDFSGGKFSQASSVYTPVDGGGNPGSVNLMISSVDVPASSTTANADTIGLNTAQLLTLGANSTTTSGPFGLGLATLAFPTVLTMHTGASLDHMNAAVFAVSLDPTNTGGTVDEVNLARTTAIPQGGTQTLTKLRGYYADLPFGDPGTTSWGIYVKDFPENFLEGSLRLGGTPGSSDTTAEKLQVGGNVLLQNASGSQPQLALSEDPDNGTNKVIVQAPATLSADYTLTLPVDDGAAGQFLKTDGAGVTSWASTPTFTAVKIQNTLNTASILPDVTESNVISTPLTLTAGTWEISGAVAFRPNGAQDITSMEAGVSLTSATLPAIATRFSPTAAGEIRIVRGLPSPPINVDDDMDLIIPSYSVVLASTTDFYLVDYSDRDGTGNQWFHYGFLEARRIE